MTKTTNYEKNWGDIHLRFGEKEILFEEVGHGVWRAQLGILTLRLESVEEGDWMLYPKILCNDSTEVLRALDEVSAESPMGTIRELLKTTSPEQLRKEAEQLVKIAELVEKWP